MFRVYYRVRTAYGNLADVSVYDCKDDEDYKRVLNVARENGYEIVDIEYISVQ